MTWKVRHEGSPRSVEGLSLDQVVEGLREGQWEPTDEVMGPGETGWQPLENHPQLALALADLEPPAPPHHEDESKLDMNPLIDVALVLLVFFILTATYETIRKVIDAPGVSAQKATQIPVVDTKVVESRMVRVKAYKQDGKTVIEVEGQPVEERGLEAALLGQAQQTRKKEILIDARGVDWGTLVAIQDAAKGAGFEKGHYLRANEAK